MCALSPTSRSLSHHSMAPVGRDGGRRGVGGKRGCVVWGCTRKRNSQHAGVGWVTVCVWVMYALGACGWVTLCVWVGAHCAGMRTCPVVPCITCATLLYLTPQTQASTHAKTPPNGHRSPTSSMPGPHPDMSMHVEGIGESGAPYAGGPSPGPTSHHAGSGIQRQVESHKRTRDPLEDTEGGPGASYMAPAVGAGGANAPPSPRRMSDSNTAKFVRTTEIGEGDMSGGLSGGVGGSVEHLTR